MRHAAMNKFYRIVWNVASQSWQAVSESARGKGKSSRSKSDGNSLINKAAILISSLLILPTAMAEPTGGNVTAGQGSIQQSGPNTTITQKSPRLAIDWNTFSINAQESVNFIQPDVSSIALNRVTGAESSGILGSLTANGQVWILNPNGVLFGNSAQVNVGGLVASTLSLSNDDFMLGKYNFSGTGGTVENRGIIKVPAGGIVALLAPVVKNNGSIIATQGNVLLAATEAVTLQPEGSSLSFTIDRGALNALAENGGLIQADGGRVVLTAAARDSLAKSVTNNTGIIEANTVQNQKGTVLLLSDMQHGTVNVSGKLSAAAPNGGNGGFIETSAATVKVTDGAEISTYALQGKTGHWLIDPTDFTIAATGGDITGTQLSTNLSNNSITIQTTTGSAGSNGDVNVNDTVTWAANKLTLNAQRNVTINSTMNGLGTAQLSLEYGQGALVAGNTSDYFVNAPVNLSAGNNFSTKLGSDGTTLQYTVITELGAPGSTTGTDLQGIQGNLAGNYVLGSNIDATFTAGGVWGTTGFSPVGDGSTAFTGTLEGLGHTVNALSINRPIRNAVGLIGSSQGKVRNIGLKDGSVIGNYYVGGLVGENYGTLSNSYATGNVSGSYYIGGLVGVNSGTLSNSYASGNVSGSYSTGGLVGYNYGTLSNSYATGNVSGNVNGSYYIGGLVGLNYGTLSNSFYDVNQGTINGARLLSLGGIYHDQFQDWLTHGKTLNIANYTTLPTSTDGYYIVSNVQGMKDMLGFATNGYRFRLRSNIDLTTAPGYFIPTFTGTFDGNSHAISNLAVFAPGNVNIGLFGLLSGTITNVGVVNANVSGQNYVGGLVGYSYGGTLTNNYATGNVSGYHSIGGLVGYNGGTLTNNYATGNVSGYHSIGGLVGLNHGTLSNNYATGNVTGTYYTGGLVGYNGNSGTLTNHYATGNVTGSNYTGGLVGFNDGALTNDYATGNVTGSNYTGGLVGVNYSRLSNSYAIGSVSGNGHTGGLVGENYGAVIASFWDIETTGQATSAGGIGLSTAEMKTQANFISATTANGNVNPNWDFTNIWKIYDGNTYPLLKSFLIPVMLDITANDVTKTYDRIAFYISANDVSYSLPGVQLSGTLTNTGTSEGAVNAGSYSINPGGLFSTQYDITYKNGTLTVNKAALGISLTASNKIYDGDTTASITGSSLTGLITGDVVDTAISGANFDTKNFGIAKTVIASIGLTGTDASNYSIDLTATTQADITAKALTLAGLTAANKIYDGDTSATITGNSLTGVITGDLVDTSITSASFDTKNAGTAKTVTASGIGLTGTDAGNYSIDVTATTQADITAKALTLAGLTAANKIYDGNTSATITGNSLTGVITGDLVDTSITSASFDTKNVGTAKTVTASGIGLTGADAGNYSVDVTATTQADITAKAVTLVSVTADNKSYDGNTTANISAKNISGLIATDEVGATVANANFDTKNAGTGKTVSVDGVALSGADAGNYSLNTTTATTLADITPKALTITGFASANKVYDRTTLATITNRGTLTGVVAGDLVNFTNTTATFSDHNAGLNKTVTLNGVVLGGLDTANYSYSAVTSDFSDITPKPVSINGFSVYDKKYDGTTLARIKNVGNLSGIITGDFLGFIYTNATFANALIGKNKTVTLNGVGLNGADALNYIYRAPTTTKASIFK